MHIFYKKAALGAFLESYAKEENSIGFVPTMGALHQGHLSLLSKSLESNTKTIISIFVNPTQFNNPEDLKKYPRTLDNDISKIEKLSPEIIIYAPPVEDIYDNQLKVRNFDFDGLENQMEGKSRPGHFDGVGTIVQKLFDIVKPTNAYFGEKDFQQLQIIKKLVSKYSLHVNIVGCPIYREANNLAMSSRNERLSDYERIEASIIYETLLKSKENFKKLSSKKVTELVCKIFENNPIFTLEYYQIADEQTLLPCIRKNKNKKYRAFIAVFVNNIRLIDTISLN